MGGADRKSGKNPALLVLAILLCLAVPHVVRLFTGPKHKKLQPVSLVKSPGTTVSADSAYLTPCKP